MLASSLMGVTNTTGMVVAAIVGGIVGALVLVFAYFVGIALIGAGLGALIAHVGWGWFRPGDPPVFALITLAVLGSIAAMLLQRYVIIVSTAFGGAWTMIVGGVAAMSDHAARVAAGADVWILYPLQPAPGQRWVSIVWVVMGVVGTAVQLGKTGRKKD
jgi:hypothetical protein